MMLRFEPMHLYTIMLSEAARCSVRSSGLVVAHITKWQMILVFISRCFWMDALLSLLVQKAAQAWSGREANLQAVLIACKHVRIQTAFHPCGQFKYVTCVYKAPRLLTNTEKAPKNVKFFICTHKMVQRQHGGKIKYQTTLKHSVFLADTK